VAQAIGRWGNYFNQELYGSPTTLPWALAIDPAHRPAATAGIGLYHPTFLYECLWDLAVALLLLWVDHRFTLARGKLFALYVAAYTLGRGWVEALRVDHANHFLGLRLNDWTSLIVFLTALAVLLWRSPGQEDPNSVPPSIPDDEHGDAAVTHGATPR